MCLHACVDNGFFGLIVLESSCIAAMIFLNHQVVLTSFSVGSHCASRCLLNTLFETDFCLHSCGGHVI